MAPSASQSVAQLAGPVQIPISDQVRERSAPLDEVVAAFHAVRASVADLFGSVGVDPSNSRESARELGLNRGLTWRLTRIVRETDPRTVVSDVPGSQSMARFFEACLRRGASAEGVAAAAASLEAFEAAVSSCAGDRKTLSMLMANSGAAASGGEAERVRRKLFEGACGVWGGQAQTRFVTVFLYPSPESEEKLEAAHVNGLIGFRRLIPRAWPLSYEAVYKASGNALPFIKEPLDPAGESEGQAQLLRGYCDPPLPEIDVVVSGDIKRFELPPGPVGNEGLTTCVFGTRLRRIYDRYSDPSSATPNTAGFLVLLQTPVERVMFDMYVHRDVGVEGPAGAQLLDRLLVAHQHIESDFSRQELPLSERARPLPRGLSGTMCPYIPWYSRMVDDVLARVGRPLEEFTGSRFEMSYPPISTVLRRWINLPLPR